MAWCGFDQRVGGVEDSAKWKAMQTMKAKQLQGDDALFWAAYRNNVQLIQERLSSGDHIDGAREGVQTPLSVAAEQNCISAVSFLCKAKADPNRADSRGITPLYVAAQKGNGKCCRMLVYAKADIDQAMEDGTTPSFVAAHHDNAFALEVLALAKANVEQPEQALARN
jgi:ankyrin repeat protein